MSYFKHWRVALLGIMVSLLAIYFITSQIDLKILNDALQAARWEFVLLCVVFLVLGLIARAFRWRLLLSGSLSFRRTFHIMNVAYMVNNVLPLRIGEVARAYLATRADPPVPVLKSVSTIVTERLLDLLAVVMLVVIGLVAGPVPDELRYTGAFFGTVGFIGFLTLVFFSRQRKLAHRILRFFTQRIVILQRINLPVLLDHFLEGLAPLARLNTLLLALFWTALGWGLSVFAGFVLMYTFYEQASFAATCLYIAAAAFAIAVPAVPGNLGTYELSIILALDAVGYSDPTTATMFAVTVHMVNLVVHAGTGLIGFIEEGVSLQQLQQGVRNIQGPEAKELGQQF